jgi:hypothetical protein
MLEELTVGRLREIIANLPDDATVLYEGDVDNRWGQYSTTEARVEGEAVVIS